MCMCPKLLNVRKQAEAREITANLECLFKLCFGMAIISQVQWLPGLPDLRKSEA